MQITILGTPYEILFKLLSEDKTLESCDAYCDYSVRHIVVREYTDADRAEDNAQKDLDVYKRKCLRHEITHAFLYESGLSVNSTAVDGWASNEEMVDWVAIQGPKLYAAWQQAGCL